VERNQFGTILIIDSLLKSIKQENILVVVVGNDLEVLLSLPDLTGGEKEVEFNFSLKNGGDSEVLRSVSSAHCYWPSYKFVILNSV